MWCIIHVMYTEQLWWGIYLSDHFNNLRVGIITIVIIVIVSGSFILAVRVSGTSNLNNGEQLTMLNNGDTTPVSNIETTLNQRCTTSIQRFFSVAQHRFNVVSTWAQHPWRRIIMRQREGGQRASEQQRARVRARERFSIVSKKGINSIRFQSSDKTTIAQVYLHF